MGNRWVILPSSEKANIPAAIIISGRIWDGFEFDPGPIFLAAGGAAGAANLVFRGAEELTLVIAALFAGLTALGLVALDLGGGPCCHNFPLSVLFLLQLRPPGLEHWPGKFKSGPGWDGWWEVAVRIMNRSRSPEPEKKRSVGGI